MGFIWATEVPKPKISRDFVRDPQPTLEISSRRRRGHVLHCCIPGKNIPAKGRWRWNGWEKLVKFLSNASMSTSVSLKIQIEVCLWLKRKSVFQELFEFEEILMEKDFGFIRTDGAREEGVKHVIYCSCTLFSTKLLHQLWYVFEWQG